ncbi:MAG: response regulator, partial [Flavobacteriales bacterium]
MKNSKGNILVVEDDKNLGSLLHEYLVAKGFDTTLCKEGEEGFDKYKKGNFDLLILDIMMPKKDGFTLAKDIRMMDENTPFIFLT